MKSLLEKRNTIYGACAIWIVLFHLFRRISMPYIPIVTNIIAIGNMGVDIFFFFSGLCLSLSATRNDYLNTGWERYFKNRLKRILLPYLIICIPYYTWASLFETSGGIGGRILKFFANIISVSFWLKGTQTTWYVYGILVFYVLFPVLYKYSKKQSAIKKTALLCGFILFAIVTSYVPILKNSMIVWARLPVFWVGIMIGSKTDNDNNLGKAQLLAAALTVLSLGWLTSFSELSEAFTLPPVYKLLLFLPMTLSLLMLISRFGRKNPIFEWVGGLSLEVYLVHITLLHPLKYFGILSALGSWLYIILPTSTLLLVWIVGNIEEQICKRSSRQ